MHGARSWAGLALGAALSLPSPGTESRGREFCERWLALPASGRHDVVVAAEARDGGSPSYRACRGHRRAAVRHKLDAECKNWKLLMDFEVRLFVDGVLSGCEPEPES